MSTRSKEAKGTVFASANREYTERTAPSMVVDDSEAGCDNNHRDRERCSQLRTSLVTGSLLHLEWRHDESTHPSSDLSGKCPILKRRAAVGGLARWLPSLFKSLPACPGERDVAGNRSDAIVNAIISSPLETVEKMSASLSKSPGPSYQSHFLTAQHSVSRPSLHFR